MCHWREQLRRTCDDNNVDDAWINVDDAWNLWSRKAEAGILRACEAAGGPALAGPSRLDRRCKDRLHCTDHAEPVDVATAGFFINSTLSPVLRFRRRMKLVGDVVKGMKNHGFTEDRWTALSKRCWQSLVTGQLVQFLLPNPGPTGFRLTCMGFIGVSWMPGFKHGLTGIARIFPLILTGGFVPSSSRMRHNWSVSL